MAAVVACVVGVDKDRAESERTPLIGTGHGRRHKGGASARKRGGTRGFVAISWRRVRLVRGEGRGVST